MRICFIAQGAALRLLHETSLALEKIESLESVSYYVEDRDFYTRYRKSRGTLARSGELLEEWELVTKGVKRRPSADEIAYWEHKLGVPSLWSAIVADRRMLNGPLCKFTQDYKSPYSLAELQGIVVTITEALWESFDRSRPDLVVAAGMATIGSQLAHHVASARGIVFLAMKGTKIQNFVSLSRDHHERHEHIRRQYLVYRRHPGDWLPESTEGQLRARAAEYLKAAKGQRLTYGGSLIQPTMNVLPKFLSFLVRAPKALLLDFQRIFLTREIDPQRPPVTRSAWYTTAGRALRIRRCRAMLRSATLTLEDLDGVPFTFFPMNSEPEIALSVLSRFTLNQIEVVRNVAQSLPLGMILVIKEHPRSWGLRSPGYYRRLLEIPNVRFVAAETPTNEVISRARLTASISSFVTFESLLQETPAVSFGYTLFDVLPSSMLRKVSDVHELPGVIAEMLEESAFDDAALEPFVMAVMRQSVAIDLYTTLLRKPGRFRGTGVREEVPAEEQYEKLARYALDRYLEERDGAGAAAQ